MIFKIVKQDEKARTGVIETKSRAIETPSYVVVATDGYIRTLEPEDIPKTQTQIAICNTFHLWQSLGEEGLNDFSGLHSFMDFDGLIMTDSGGFQVFSIGSARKGGVKKVQGEQKLTGKFRGESRVRVIDSGVYFLEDQKENYLDAELSIKIQEQLQADIILAFDEPTSPLDSRSYNERALKRTHAWALRSLEAKTSDQWLYGIVQGGKFEDLRKKSSKYIGSLPFEGFAVGGSFGKSFGSQQGQMLEEIDWSLEFLPPDKPRHLLGIGRIEDIFEAVERGIDTMDCVIPTREARHGGIWSQSGRLDIQKGKFLNDTSPLIENCVCPVCHEEGITKSRLSQLFKEKNPEAGRFATIHNVFFFNSLMKQVRESIKAGRFKEFKKDYLGGQATLQ